MRVLAIDTALGACAAAVLDSQRGAILASESLADGARPCRSRDAADRARDGRGALRIRRARPHRRHGRARQLHRPARRHFGGARHRARGRQAGDRAVDARRRSPPRMSRRAPITPSSRRSMRATSRSISRCSRRTARPSCRRGSTACAPRCAPCRSGRPCITGSGAALVAAHWPSGSPTPRVEVHAAPDIGWVARLGAAAQDEGTAPKPLYLRRPDARPQDAGRLPRR